MVQRVSEARVHIDSRVVGEIGPGLVVLLGVGRDDGPQDVTYVVGKIRDIRIFEGEGGRNMDHVCIATGPCEEQAMRAHLSRHGINIVEEGIRYGAKGDGMSFYICDPSGNQIELKGPVAD